MIHPEGINAEISFFCNLLITTWNKRKRASKCRRFSFQFGIGGLAPGNDHFTGVPLIVKTLCATCRYNDALMYESLKAGAFLCRNIQY